MIGFTCGCCRQFFKDFPLLFSKYGEDGGSPWCSDCWDEAHETWTRLEKATAGLIPDPYVLSRKQSCESDLYLDLDTSIRLVKGLLPNW